MIITSIHRFVVVLLALVSRRADASLSCKFWNGDFYILVENPKSSCRADDYNDVFNNGKRGIGWLYCHKDHNAVSFFLGGLMRPSLLRGTARTPRGVLVCAAL